jgi:hypothetical protein
MSTAEDLREQLARAIDREAFNDHPAELRSHAAAIQWAARRKMARDAADKVLQPIVEAVDLCWKATPFGEREDGDVHTYIVPKGVVHRLVGALQGIGVSASLRAFDPPASSPEPKET